MEIATPAKPSVPIALGGETYAMRLDWRGFIKLRRLFPEGEDLMDPEHLAAVMEIALAAEHPDVTAARIMDLSPLIEPCILAVHECRDLMWYGCRRDAWVRRARGGDNPTRGTASVLLDGKEHALRLNWHRMVKVRRQYPDGYNLADLEHLSAVLALALEEFHPEVTAEHVLDLSPPVEDAILDVTDCINYAWWGAPEVPERREEDERQNPPRKRAAKAA